MDSGTNWLLMGAALLIYAFDACIFLCHDEALLIGKPKNRFLWRLANSGFILLRKLVIMPSLLAPHRPVFRTRWSPKPHDPDRSPDVENVDELSGELLAFRPFIWAMFLCLFVVVPIGLFVIKSWSAVLIAMAAYYVYVIIALAWMFTGQTRRRIGTGRFLAIAFESLVCPPCALNMIRHVSLSVTVEPDFVDLCARLLEPSALKVCLSDMQRVIDSILDETEENSAQYTKLRQYRLQLGRHAQ